VKKVEMTFYEIREQQKPNPGDELIIVGEKLYDVITYDGGFLPAWVEYWGKIDLRNL